MQPLSIELENIFQHTYRTFEFHKGTTGIIGKNGDGKSNFLEAIHFGITGQTQSDLTKSDMLNWHASAGRVRFSFRHNGADYVLERAVHSSHCKMTSESLTKPLKGAEANAFMEDVLGMSFKAFYETCWTPQGSLTDVLTMSHSYRVAFFQRLAKTRQAEVVRGIIQESGLQKLPNYLDKTLEIEQITAEINQLTADVETLTESLTTIEKLYTQYKEKQPQIQMLLALPTEGQYVQCVTNAQLAVSRAEKDLLEFEQGNNLVVVPEAVPPSADMEKARADSERLSMLTQQLDPARKDLTAVMLKGSSLVSPEEPSPLVDEHVESNRALMEMVPKYQLAVKGVCPTCERPFEFEGGEVGKKAVIESYKAAYAVTESLAKKARDAQDAYAVYQGTHSRITADIQACDRRIESIQQQIDSIGDVQFDNAVYTEQVRAYQSYTSYLHAAAQQQQQLQVYQQSLSRATDGLAAAEAVVYSKEKDRTSAVEFMENFNALQEQRNTTNGHLSGQRSRLEVQKGHLAGLQAEQSKRQEVAHTRSVFERCREVFHRENLPKLVMQKVLYGMNALLDKYLAVFDTNFTAYINEEFDFMCNFALKSDAPTRTLSGGQKVVLSLAFKFAVSDLLASQVPIMVLDEPTIWLDEINKPRLAEVLTKARSVTEKGVYVLIATHEPILFPSFSRAYNVGS